MQICSAVGYGPEAPRCRSRRKRDFLPRLRPPLVTAASMAHKVDYPESNGHDQGATDQSLQPRLLHALSTNLPHNRHCQRQKHAR
jgi:hypothetical protein